MKGPEKWRLENVRLVTMDAGRRILDGAIEVHGDRIAAVGEELPPPAPGVTCLDRSGCIVLPGFVQGHVHLCQTLMRGLADGRRLDRWLRERIWPLEAAHDPGSMTASARLGIAESLLAGTTTLLDMGSVHHTGVIAEAIAEMGVRAIIGKALMDSGDGVPPGLRQDSETALREAQGLVHTWQGACEGRIGVAFAPRFTLSVSPELWRQIAQIAQRDRILVHTHISETPWENQSCRALHGDSPVAALAAWGVLEAPAVLVHAVWIESAEREILRSCRAGIVHCPGSNARLGSGIADVAALLEAGLPVALGSDGAACNDLLSIPSEMRLATQLQSLRHGPERMDPAAPLEMATCAGARALGLEKEVGSLEPGKCADLQVLRAGDLEGFADQPLHQVLALGSSPPRPQEVFVAGCPRVADGNLVGLEIDRIRAAAGAERRRLLERAGL
jgi:cytosine/adenosine deaminase-related metal-dependent hydrolase